MGMCLEFLEMSQKIELLRLSKRMGGFYETSLERGVGPDYIGI